jgi:hypothetical protein
MDRFVEITDEKAIRYVNLGTCFNELVWKHEDWKKMNFWPKKGVVGQVQGEAVCHEGKIYFVQVSESIIAAVLPKGIKDIPFSEAKVKFYNNRNIGHVSESEFIELQVKAHNDEMKKWF